MAAVDDYADINISFEAQTVSRAGFGTLLFITEDTTFTSGTVKGVYGSLSEVSNDYADTAEPYKFAQAAFGQGNGFSKLKIGHKDSTGDTWSGIIGDIIDSSDSDWYALAIESRTAADIEAVAAEIQARGRLFIGVSADAAILDDQDDTDIASTVLSNTYNRTGVFYKSDGATTYPEAAWFGRQLPEDPGTTNWAYKSLSGVAADSLTTADRSAIRAKRANYYEEIAGNPITYAGYTGEAGKFLDIIRGVDWLRVRMQEDYIALQTSQDRIPYVGGGEIIESEVVRRRLDIAVDEGVIAEGYTVTTPTYREQDSTDRSARDYPGITFKATYVGAVNTAGISGVVSP
jgi:hypothetical protein